MGLSMGGNNAYLFAAAHPDRVDRLVVLDIGPEVATAGTQRIMASIDDGVVFGSEEEAVAQARAANPRPSDETLRRRVTHNLRTLPDGTLTFKWDMALRAGSAIRDDHTVEERWEAWRAVRCPVLLVRGDDSDILAVETAERMLKENPRRQPDRRGRLRPQHHPRPPGRAARGAQTLASMSRAGIPGSGPTASRMSS